MNKTYYESRPCAMACDGKPAMKRKAVQRFELGIEQLDAVCRSEEKFGEDSEALFNRVLGHVEMAEFLGLVSSEEAENLACRLIRRKEAWQKLFAAQKLLDEVKEELSAEF